MSARKKRINPNALVAREDLLFALTKPQLVQRAIDMRQCLLCCNHPVNEAGLCDECFSSVNDEERRRCESYIWKTEPMT